jgi:hypothetical protein
VEQITTVAEAAGGPPPRTLSRLLQLEVVNLLSGTNITNMLGDQVVAAGEDHPGYQIDQKDQGGQGVLTTTTFNLMVTDSGVELLNNQDEQQTEFANVTKIPVHLKHFNDMVVVVGHHHQQQQQQDIVSTGVNKNDFQGRQIMSPIDVGLQLGHPASTPCPPLGEEEPEKSTAELLSKATIPVTETVGAALVDTEAQTENLPGENVEVQTTTPPPHDASFENHDGLEDSSSSSRTRRPSLQETSSQTEGHFSIQPPEPPDTSTETAEENISRTTILVPPVTSETQTNEVQHTEFCTQTLEKDCVDIGSQTEATFEGTEDEDEDVGPIPISQRPPTLPGSSIDLPAEVPLAPQGSYLANLIARTRTVSPDTLRVQDDVVARVLLEHLGTVFPDTYNPRNGNVNYLDLSRLGDEGETPASDEIWLAVDGSEHSEDEAGDDEDKFLTTEDTDTYSVHDKLSTAETMAGYGPTALLAAAPSSANLLSDQELADLGGCESFDAEAEATARLQGVLAGELMPLQTTLFSTDQNIVGLADKFIIMERVLTTLCSTVTSLQSQVGNAGQSRYNNGSRTSTPPSEKGDRHGIKKGETALIDQLVARIEHLSSDVANMDNTRQLREDNLLLRQELQGYRDRELAMMTRLETMDKRLNEMSQDQTRTRQDNSSRRPKSRRGSLGSSRGTPELPPIETNHHRSRSIDSPKPALVVNGDTTEAAETIPNIIANGGEIISAPNAEDPVTKTGQLDKMMVKAPLIAQSKTQKNVTKMLRRSSNSSSSSNDIDVKGIQRRKPITPKLDADFLQTEIQIARSDNSILRQDIQVFRERENQLFRRNRELEEHLIAAVSPMPGGGPADNETKKSEVNINVDFVSGDDKSPRRAVIEAEVIKKVKKVEENRETEKPTKEPTAKMKVEAPPAAKKEATVKITTPPKRDQSKERKPAPIKKEPPAKKRDASKDRKKSSGSDGEGGSNKPKVPTPPTEAAVVAIVKEEVKEATVAEEASEETAGKKELDDPKGPKVEIKKAAAGPAGPAKKTGVPKTKNPIVKAANKLKPITATKSKTSTSPKVSTSSSSAEDNDKKATTTTTHENIIEDDDWKVTITSKHELETVTDEPNKTITVTPKTPPQQEVVLKKEVLKKGPVAKIKAKVVAAVNKGDRKIYDARSDPIPKPPQYPAARPPRGYVPPRQATNTSLGVAGSFAGGHGPRSGRASSIESDSEIQMHIKQEPRNSFVEGAPHQHPPICQVSYDSVYDSVFDPYYSCSY